MIIVNFYGRIIIITSMNILVMPIIIIIFIHRKILIVLKPWPGGFTNKILFIRSIYSDVTLKMRKLASDHLKLAKCMKQVVASRDSYLRHRRSSQRSLTRSAEFT